MFEKTCNKRGFHGGCYKKSELDIDDKKALEIESEANKPLLMAQVCLKRMQSQYRKIASLTPNGGAFL
ncbi:hypothetical protein SLK260_09950 [Helicobacter pylori]